MHQSMNDIGVAASLRRYVWTETVRFLLKDELRSTWKVACRYGPDGKVVRTPVGPPPPGTTAGPFAPKGRESKDELDETMIKVRTVVGMYVPPETSKLEQAYEAADRARRAGAPDAFVGEHGDRVDSLRSEMREELEHGVMAPHASIVLPKESSKGVGVLCSGADSSRPCASAAGVTVGAGTRTVKPPNATDGAAPPSIPPVEGGDGGLDEVSAGGAAPGAGASSC